MKFEKKDPKSNKLIAWHSWYFNNRNCPMFCRPKLQIFPIHSVIHLKNTQNVYHTLMLSWCQAHPIKFTFSFCYFNLFIFILQIMDEVLSLSWFLMWYRLAFVLERCAIVLILSKKCVLVYRICMQPFNFIAYFYGNETILCEMDGQRSGKWTRISRF